MEGVGIQALRPLPFLSSNMKILKSAPSFTACSLVPFSLAGWGFLPVGVTHIFISQGSECSEVLFLFNCCSFPLIVTIKQGGTGGISGNPLEPLGSRNTLF